MSEKGKGEVVARGHGAAVKEAIEDAKRAHVRHPHSPGPQIPAGPPQAFQGNGGAIQ